MKNFYLGLSLAGALLLALTPHAAAQTTQSTAAYTGPRFPSGPDSLRAFMRRRIQTVSASPGGRAAAEFEL